MDADFEAELQSLLAQGQKIEAIKRYREQYGVGLKEAKDAVDILEGGEKIPQIGPSNDDEEIVSLLEQGRKIEAIKLYREKTGSGLKEAKDAIEALARERGIPSGAGCFAVVLILLAFLIGWASICESA